jgi:hypothetical protein
MAGVILDQYLTAQRLEREHDEKLRREAWRHETMGRGYRMVEYVKAWGELHRRLRRPLAAHTVEAGAINPDLQICKSSLALD